MLKKSEFVCGLFILFMLFITVQYFTSQDINEMMRQVKRPVVLHDTTSIMRYVDRYIHDTITVTKTEYVEKVSMFGKMQDFATETTEQTVNIISEEYELDIPTKYIKYQCNGKLIPDEDGDLNTCVGEWVITIKEDIE